MCRGTMVLLVCLLLQAPAMGQTVRSVVDCGGKRLTGAERETCASPDLMRLTKDVDQLTGQLEATWTGRNKEALVDTERPFMVERNNCQNATSALHQDYASVVRACVERLLRGRLDALRAAGTSPGSIVSEIGQYSFWSIANFVKWGPELLGKHVRLWGCMALDPGPTPGSRRLRRLEPVRSSLLEMQPSCSGLRPNKRLKLSGGDRFKGSGELCASAHELSFNDGRAGERVARSLSAIR